MRSVAPAALSACKPKQQRRSCFPAMDCLLQLRHSQHPHHDCSDLSSGLCKREKHCGGSEHKTPLHPLCGKLEASPSSPHILPCHRGWTWLLQEPGTLSQCPPSCLRKPHTRDLTLVHMGSPWLTWGAPGLSLPALSTAGACSQAFHPGLPLLLTISTKLVKKRVCAAPWRMS